MSNDLPFIHPFEPGQQRGTLAQPRKLVLAPKPVLITSGQRDPIIPASNAAELAGQLMHAGANVQHSVLPTVHELTQIDVTFAKEWMKTALLPEAVASGE